MTGVLPRWSEEVNAVGERTDVVAQRLVGAIHHDRDSREDERVFVIVWPRVLRTTDSRAQMNIFVTNSIFTPPFNHIPERP